MANLYEKLQTMRCDLQEMQLKKSGKNAFAGYEYFELQDFLPKINNLMLAAKVSSYICFDKDKAQLTLVDMEKPEDQVYFTCPMAEANLKGCHPVQNLGATLTYLRRYLYVNAFEIVEQDALDSSKPIDAPKKLYVQSEEPRQSYSKPSAPMATDDEQAMRVEITDMIRQMFGIFGGESQDKTEIQEKIKGYSLFLTDKGEEKYKTSTLDLRGKWLANVYKKVKADFSEWQKMGEHIDFGFGDINGEPQ